MIPDAECIKIVAEILSELKLGSFIIKVLVGLDLIPRLACGWYGNGTLDMVKDVHFETIPSHPSHISLYSKPAVQLKSSYCLVVLDCLLKLLPPYPHLSGHSTRLQSTLIHST